MQRDAIIHAAALAGAAAAFVAERVLLTANVPLDRDGRGEKRGVGRSGHDTLANLFPATGTERCCLAVHRILDQSGAADRARGADAKGMRAVIAGRDMRVSTAGDEETKEHDLPHEARSITLQAASGQD